MKLQDEKFLKIQKKHTYGGVLFLVKLWTEKFLKPNQKTPVAESGSYHKIFSKFTRKQMYLSLIFNGAAGWKISQNSQENTCAGISF